MTTLDLVTGRHHYKAILIDPPWGFRTYSGKDVIPSRAKVQAYKPMSWADLKALPIKELADPSGCVLFMWTTYPFLEL